jgi:hypothetical protein
MTATGEVFRPGDLVKLVDQPELRGRVVEILPSDSGGRACVLVEWRTTYRRKTSVHSVADLRRRP